MSASAISDVGATTRITLPQTNQYAKAKAFFKEYFLFIGKALFNDPFPTSYLVAEVFRLKIIPGFPSIRRANWVVFYTIAGYRFITEINPDLKRVLINSISDAHNLSESDLNLLAKQVLLMNCIEIVFTAVLKTYVPNLSGLSYSKLLGVAYATSRLKNLVGSHYFHLSDVIEDIRVNSPPQDLSHSQGTPALSNNVASTANSASLATPAQSNVVVNEQTNSKSSQRKIKGLKGYWIDPTQKVLNSPIRATIDSLSLKAFAWLAAYLSFGLGCAIFILSVALIDRIVILNFNDFSKNFTFKCKNAISKYGSLIKKTIVDKITIFKTTISSTIKNTSTKIKNAVTKSIFGK